MYFSSDVREQLPPLSWLVIMRKGEEEVKILRGVRVECEKNFFVSGCWDGDFEAVDFLNAHFACCTGGIIGKHEELKLCTPDHMQESIYSVKKDNIYYFSNSIAFILAKLEYELDKGYMFYEEDFNSVYFGIKRCVNNLRLANGEILTMHRLCNISIDKDFNVKTERRTSGLHFYNFNDYYSKLLCTMKKIRDNAQSVYRKFQYGMVTTISRGYDAPCVSVIAHEIGCDKALTFNSPAKYKEDNGAEIARKLGFSSIEEGDGNLYKSNTDLWEAENSGSGATGCAVQFNAFEKNYENCLLFMGVRGDSLWNKNAVGVNSDMDYLSLDTDADLNFEHYYRTNTIVIYLPMFAADSWPDIHRISNSEEMKSWCTNNNYDKPIPRRIVESKGIERKDFGYAKMGAGISLHFETLGRLKNKMSPMSYKSLLDFKKSLHRNIFQHVSMYFYVIKYYFYNYHFYFNYLFDRFHIPISLKDRRKKYMSSPISSLLILWGMSEMKKRYKKAL